MFFYAEDYDPMKRDIGIDFISVNDAIFFISTVDIGYSSIIGSSRYETMIFLEGEKTKEELNRLPKSVKELSNQRITYKSREEAEEGHQRVVSIIKDMSNLN